MSDPIELDRWITICGTDYFLLDPAQVVAVHNAMQDGEKITAKVSYQVAGMDEAYPYHMEGTLRIDPNQPCGRLTTKASIKEGKMPWPGKADGGSA